MGRLVLKEGKKYTFSDYFEFNNPPEEIAAAFGYSFDTAVLQFPTWKGGHETDAAAMQKRFYEILPKIALNSEMAKRDFMIAPVLWSIISHVKARINVEYTLDVDDSLSGSLDYLICSTNEMVVIEAKKGDLDRGFNQLIAELIALDRYEAKQGPAMLYGAVSIGELWRFCILERTKKHLCRDLHTWRVPEDIEQLFALLLGILQP
jgi:hypothetical protein